MYWQNKTVLVTGASGFIGSHLVEYLLNQGANVRALVHYNSRNDQGNLRYLSQSLEDKLEVIMGNIEDSGCVDSVVAGCDCVFHLAALIGIPYSYVAPRSYVATNVVGTLNVLEAVRHCDVPKMVHTSTSEVYGTAQYEPINENHPIQGQSPYSATKIGADKLVESFFRSFAVPVATMRPFNTYGPRQSARAVIPTIISQLLSGKTIIELGSLTPLRDLTFVEDTVKGFIAIAESDKANGETINIGSGKAISIGDLAQIIITLTGTSARVVSKTERVRPDNSEVKKLICDNQVALKTLGWKPTVSLKEGLIRTIDFIKTNPAFYQVDRYVV